MGSGISTKYENTYFYKRKDEEPLTASEKTYGYNINSEMGEGGQMKYLTNHHGIQSRLMDGTDVTFRPYPKSIGSPAVEVRIRFESLIHKIHFILR